MMTALANALLGGGAFLPCQTVANLVRASKPANLQALAQWRIRDPSARPAAADGERGQHLDFCCTLNSVYTMKFMEQESH